MTRLRSFIARFALFALSCLASLLMAEGLLRIIRPQQLILLRPDIWCPAEKLGWKHCPNVDTAVNSGEGPVHFQSDHDGFRINPNRLRGQPDIRLLVLGDSFMEAIQVESNETTAERIAASLEARHGISVAVTNTGVGQWDPNQYLIQAREELSRRPYNMGLVFIFLGNDIISESVESFPPRKPVLHHQVQMPTLASWQKVIDSILYPVNDFLETRSHLFILLKRGLSVLRMRLRLSGESLAPVFLKENASSPMWDVTTNICRRITTEFRKYNVPIIFVLIPASYQLDSEEFQKLVWGFGIPEASVDLGQPNRILKERLISEKLTVVDPLPLLRERFWKGEHLYGNVDNHLNATGHRILAESVLPVIEENLAPSLKFGQK